MQVAEYRSLLLHMEWADALVWRSVLDVSEARELFGYSAWANGRVFEAAEALTTGPLSATIASSFPSIRGTLAHIVATEWIWLRRWRGESPAAAPGWVEYAGTSGSAATLGGSR